MKLCRFETLDEPGTARSGFAYEGRIIETDGTQPIATFEGTQVRLLAPIGRPNSVRLFRDGLSSFDYLHPSVVFGPNQTLQPAILSPIRYLPCVAAVLVGRAFAAPSHQADDLIMGICFAHVFRYSDVEGASAVDVGVALGPALCTPDEFDATSVRPSDGVAYSDQVTLLQNSVDAARFELSAMAWSFAQLISTASSTLPVGDGDLLLAPLEGPELQVEPGDELRLTSSRIGSLIVRLAR